MVPQERNVQNLLTNLSNDQINFLFSIMKQIAEENDQQQQEQPQQQPQVSSDEIAIQESASIENILNILNEIQNASLVVGNKEQKLRNWFNSVSSLLNTYNKELTDDQNRLNLEFTKSLDTISKIFKVLKCYPEEIKDDSVMSYKIQKIINDYRLGNFVDLKGYCNEGITMTQLNNEVESNIIKLKPILLDKILAISFKLDQFYNILDLIDGYSNSEFLSQIPTREETTRFLKIDEVEDIKEIMHTNFCKSSPRFLEEIELEITRLNGTVKFKTSEMLNILEELSSLRDILDIQPNEIESIKFSTEQELISKVGLKSTVKDKLEARLSELKKVKADREANLNTKLKQVEELWAILRPNDHSIQEFLKLNKNLKLSSLTNFDILLDELEQEKTLNLSKFIESSRSRIQGFWNLLMYDESEKLRFDAFYVQDVAKFDEYLLELHNKEIQKLRQEAESLKPLLKLISNMDQLLQEKKQLDDAVKDPQRLLKRDSFKILRQEEKLRDRVNKLLPSTLSELKSQISLYEQQKGKIFKVNGEPYSQKLEEYENEFTRKKFTRRSPIKQIVSHPQSSASRRLKRQVSNLNSKNPLSALRSTRPVVLNSYNNTTNIGSNNGSIIRRQNTVDMVNPFDSKESSPLKRRKPNAQRESNIEEEEQLPPQSVPGLKRVDPPVFVRKPVMTSSSPDRRLATNSSSIELLSGSTISNIPIVIKGGSPMKQNEYQSPPGPSNILPKRQCHDHIHTQIPKFTPRTSASILSAIPQVRLPSLSPSRSTMPSPPTLRKKMTETASARKIKMDSLNLNFNSNRFPIALRPLQNNQNGLNNISPKKPTLRPYDATESSIAELSDSMIEYGDDIQNKENSRMINKSTTKVNSDFKSDNHNVLGDIMSSKNRNMPSPGSNRPLRGNLLMSWETDTF